MDDQPIVWVRGEYVVSTQRLRLDLPMVLELLRSTHWGQDLTEVVLRRAVSNSVCFGVYQGSDLVGFGRVITDLATYGYLTDVVIAPAHRGRGLSVWLTECMLSHPELRGFRRTAVVTRDAERLYLRAGFTPGAGPLVYLERR
jgi:GNAT superfamily N-acetyltransferase